MDEKKVAVLSTLVLVEFFVWVVVVSIIESIYISVPNISWVPGTDVRLLAHAVLASFLFTLCIFAYLLATIGEKVAK